LVTFSLQKQRKSNPGCRGGATRKYISYTTIAREREPTTAPLSPALSRKGRGRTTNWIPAFAGMTAKETTTAEKEKGAEGPFFNPTNTVNA
jgi:hypothetical protein